MEHEEQNQQFPINDESHHHEERLTVEHEKNTDLDAGTEGTLTVDVYQDDDFLVVEATVAGVSPESMEVNVTNEAVAIRGERRRDKKIEEEDFYYQELFWGVFSRTVILPSEVDPERSEAIFRNGILTIRMPLMERRKAKKINVRVE